MSRASFLLFVVLFYSVSAQIAVGTYRQCNLDTGDEIILDVGPGLAPQTEMTFSFGGCLNGEVQYEIVSNYDWLFEQENDDGSYNVSYNYQSAFATPYTQEAADSFALTCGSSFPVNETTNVLGCLFCPIRYDIFKEIEPEVFVLGDGISCIEADRPTEFEESLFVLAPYYADDADYNPNVGFSNTLEYQIRDDDLDDDFSSDEDDEEIYIRDDDDEYSSASTVIPVSEISFLYTFSHSPEDFTVRKSGASCITASAVLFVALFFFF